MANFERQSGRGRHLLVRPEEPLCALIERCAAREGGFAPLVVLTWQGGRLPVDLMVDVIGWLTGEENRRVGLAVVDLPAIPIEWLVRLMEAGLSLLEVTVPAASRDRYDQRLGRKDAASQTVSCLQQLSRLARHPMVTGGRHAFPALEIDLRVPMGRGAASEPEAWLALTRDFSRYGHRMRVELWPRRGSHGRALLPPWQQIRRLVVRLLDQARGSWSLGRASVALVGATGRPRCLLSGTPEYLPAFRLKSLDPSDVTPRNEPAAAACLSCVARPWCAATTI